VPEPILTATAPTSIAPGHYGNQNADGVVLRAELGGSLISIQTGRSQEVRLAAAIRETFAVELPETPLLAVGTECSLLWSGRLQWFAMAQDNDLLRRLNPLRELGSLSDQSDARCIVEISGPKARETLAKLAPVDLHPRVFQKHTTALTVLGHVAGQITQIGDEPTFQLMVFRSFAENFWSSLVEAGEEYGVNISS
jgi:sarcosine oxidase subunit gamma